MNSVIKCSVRSNASVLLVFVLVGVSGVRITNLIVPEVIENGTQDSVVLDCEYTFKEYEKVGLVLRWYFNDFSSPVYQWIPNQKPKDLGVLKGKVNLDYKATQDPYAEHRALHIISPTTELSGRYQCKISSFEGEDSQEKRMIVYAPARWVDLKWSKPASDRVNVTCEAKGIYPEPRLRLFQSSPHSPRKEVQGGTTETLWRLHLYDILTYKVFEDWSLEEENVFECELWIPDTEYSVRKELIYYPGVPDEDLGEPPRTETPSSPPTRLSPSHSSSGGRGSSQGRDLLLLLLTAATSLFLPALLIPR